MDEQGIKQAFGSVLREARHAVRLSQEKLALRVGLDRTYISMLERGLRQPSLTTILILSAELNLTAPELLRRTLNRFE